MSGEHRQCASRYQNNDNNSREELGLTVGPKNTSVKSREVKVRWSLKPRYRKTDWWSAIPSVAVAGYRGLMARQLMVTMINHMMGNGNFIRNTA